MSEKRARDAIALASAKGSADPNSCLVIVDVLREWPNNSQVAKCGCDAIWWLSTDSVATVRCLRSAGVEALLTSIANNESLSEEARAAAKTALVPWRQDGRAGWPTMSIEEALAVIELAKTSDEMESACALVMNAFKARGTNIDVVSKALEVIEALMSSNKEAASCLAQEDACEMAVFALRRAAKAEHITELALRVISLLSTLHPENAIILGQKEAACEAVLDLLRTPAQLSPALLNAGCKAVCSLASDSDNKSKLCGDGSKDGSSSSSSNNISMFIAVLEAEVENGKVAFWAFKTFCDLFVHEANKSIFKGQLYSRAFAVLLKWYKIHDGLGAESVRGAFRFAIDTLKIVASNTALLELLEGGGKVVEAPVSKKQLGPRELFEENQKRQCLAAINVLLHQVDDHEAVAEAFIAIDRLAGEEPNLTVFSSSNNGCKAVVAALCTHASSSERLACLGLCAIGSLALDEACTLELYQAGACTAILHALRVHPASDVVAIQGARAVRYLATESTILTHALLRQGATSVLTAITLNSGIKNGCARQSAQVALATLSLPTPIMSSVKEALSSIKKRQNLRLMISAIRAHVGNVRVAEQGVSAIHELVRFASHAPKLVEACACEALVEIIAVHLANASIVESVCDAINPFLYGREHKQEDESDGDSDEEEKEEGEEDKKTWNVAVAAADCFKRANVAALLSEALKIHSTRFATFSSCCDTIFWLAARLSPRGTILRELRGSCLPVAEFLRNHIKNDRAVSNVAWIIGELCLLPENKQTFLDAGVIALLTTASADQNLQKDTRELVKRRALLRLAR